MPPVFGQNGAMFERIGRDRMAVGFTGGSAGTAPLTWGQQAILRDMADNRSQFSMGGWTYLPEGSTVGYAAGQLSGLLGRHAALRTRLADGAADRPCQEVAGAGQIGLDIWTIPDDAGPDDLARCVDDLIETWPLEPFDFRADWPLRMAVLRQGGACLRLVWVLSHLAADGAAHLLLLRDLRRAMDGGATADPGSPQLPDVAASEREPRLRALSGRSMPYWQSQLRGIPALTFGQPARPADDRGPRYRRVRFSSVAAHLAMLAIARRTGTDASRVTAALIATAIGRVTGAAPLTVSVMMNNRFRPGLADVIAPIAQNVAVTIDVAGTTVDAAVARARGAYLAAGLRAYYDPDDLDEVIARADAERGYPARVSCRVNDQRAMIRGAARPADPAEVTEDAVRGRLGESALTWLGPLDHLHDQANIIVENRPGVLSLSMLCDLWSLPGGRAEALLRAVEDVAVEAAFDSAAPTGVAPGA